MNPKLLEAIDLILDYSTAIKIAVDEFYPQNNLKIRGIADALETIRRLRGTVEGLDVQHSGSPELLNEARRLLAQSIPALRLGEMEHITKICDFLVKVECHFEVNDGSSKERR